MAALSKALDFSKEQYPALTGVRALGASIIFFDHFPLSAGHHITLNVMAFFFALSGFLIVRIYYAQACLRLEWLGKYFVNRFARIYPVYFLLLSIAVLLHGDYRPWILLKNYTLTNGLFYGEPFIIPPSWSLTVEECFYFLAPVFILLARRSGFLAPFALAASLLAIALGISTLDISFLHTAQFVFGITFFGHFAEFFAGVYLALAVIKFERLGALRTVGTARTVTGLAGVSLLIGAMVPLYWNGPPNYTAVVIINNFLIPLPIAVLYSGLLREVTPLSRLLSGRVAGLLGRSSYSFYLLHTLIINYIAIPYLLPLISSRSLCVLLTFTLTWLLSVLLFVLYEEPINLFIRRKFHSKDRSVGMQATLFQVRS